MEVTDPIQERKVSNMDALTYDTGLWRSERNTAGIPPQRFGHDTACLVTDPLFNANNSTLPVTFADAKEGN